MTESAEVPAAEAAEPAGVKPAGEAAAAKNSAEVATTEPAATEMPAESAAAKVATAEPAAAMTSAESATAARERVGRNGGASKHKDCGQDGDLARNDHVHLYCLSVEHDGKTAIRRRWLRPDG